MNGRFFDVNDVVTFRMTSGEEIIAKYKGDHPTYFEVEAPLMLAQGQNGLQMIPPVYSADVLQGSTPLYKNTVMMAAKSKDDAADHYRQTTTGIQVPSKQILTG
jgi:hypothetical protein